MSIVEKYGLDKDLPTLEERSNGVIKIGTKTIELWEIREDVGKLHGRRTSREKDIFSDGKNLG